MAYKNIEDKRASDRRFYQKHREERRSYKREYYIKNKEKILEHKKEYQNEYREHINEIVREWKEKNKEKIIMMSAQYRKNNIDKIREYRNSREYKDKINLWLRKRRKNDLKCNISEKMSNNIRKSIRENKNGWHWEDLVGYKLIDLIKYLKSTMPGGYTWEDYLNGKLHIDHIIPIDAFNFTKSTHPDFNKCWELNNLRLLSAKENIIKSNKLIKAFQPSLQIEF